MKKRPLPITARYDTTAFFWGLMYQAGKRGQPRIVRLYPRGRDAQKEANRINREWESKFGDRPYSVLRFRYYFRGTEIDAYIHGWERLEKTKLPTGRG